MPGVLQVPDEVLVAVQDGDTVELDLTLEEGIALALEMCPEGEAIEVHEPWCDVEDCSCLPRVIQKPVRASS